MILNDKSQRRNDRFKYFFVLHEIQLRSDGHSNFTSRRPWEKIVSGIVSSTNIVKNEISKQLMVKHIYRGLSESLAFTTTIRDIEEIEFDDVN